MCQVHLSPMYGLPNNTPRPWHRDIWTPKWILSFWCGTETLPMGTGNSNVFLKGVFFSFFRPKPRMPPPPMRRCLTPWSSATTPHGEAQVATPNLTPGDSLLRAPAQLPPVLISSCARGRHSYLFKFLNSIMVYLKKTGYYYKAAQFSTFIYYINARSYF